MIVKPVRNLFIFSVILLYSSSALATVVITEWNGGTTGSWSDALSWSSGSIPNDTATDQYSVFIDNNAGQDSTVTLNLSVFVTNLTVDAGDHLSVQGGSSLLVSGATSGSGTIETDGSSSVSTLGLLEGVTYNGTGGALINTAGTVRDVTSNGSGNLLLGGSTWDGVITNNTQIQFVDSAITGSGHFDAATLAGTGTLTGAGTLTASTGTSTLTISGDQTGDTLTLLTNGGTLVVDGTLRATDGSNLQLDSDVTGMGMIETDGSSVVSTLGLLEGVTYNGTGGALINTGGTVRDVTNSAGTLMISDSALSGHISNVGTLQEFSADKLINIGTATELALIDGSVEGDLHVGSGGVLSGSGAITGDLTLASDGVLRFGLSGTNALLGEYDQIHVFDDPLTGLLSGDALLAGTIDLLFVGGFSPSFGDTFDLITAESIIDDGFTFGFDNLAPILGLGYSGDIISANSRDVLRLTFFRENIAAPEPGTFLLLLLGLATMFVRLSRRQKHLKPYA